MVATHGIIHAKPATQRIQIIRHAGKARFRHRQAVNHAAAIQGRALTPKQLSIQKAEIEGRVMRNDFGITQEFQQLTRNRREFRLAGDITIGEAVNARSLGRDIAFRINHAVKRLTRWQQIE